MQTSFNLSDHPETIIAEFGDVRLFRHWLASELVQEYFEQLAAEIEWSRSRITIAGKTQFIPRLNAWYGDLGCSYAYSGIRFNPLAWTPQLWRLKLHLESFLTAEQLMPSGFRFNSALVNFYRDGQDSVAWHADDEPELGEQPLIASISLGAVRRFSFKPKAGGVIAQKTINLDLDAGSLLLMAGATQRHWLHQLPKTRAEVLPRINVTFRHVCTK